jgi:hypothetical protein
VQAILDAYGWTRSRREALPVDREGRPLPMYTYPAIEYLDGLDLAACDIFEFGSGQSSLWWAARARSVTAVEHDDRWARRLTDAALPNVRCIFVERHVIASGERYAGLAAAGGPWHVIVLDGLHQHDCAAASPAALADGGLIILDNSDYYPDTCARLRAGGLLQVDMAGLKPCHDDTQVTSLFFDRRFALPPRGGRQPHTSIGGRPYISPFDRPRRIEFKGDRPVIR